MRVVLTRRESLESQDGVSLFIVALAQALLDMGHDVTIVLGWLECRSTFERLLAPRLDLPIIALSNKPLAGVASALAWLKSLRLINGLHPDLIIHSEAIPIPYRGTLVQAVHDLQPRSSRLAPVWRSIRRLSTRRCHHVVATTTELRDALVRDLGLPPERIRLIPKCIDRSSYAGKPLPLRDRAILHAGTLPYKDPAASIRAFGKLNDPTVQLYVTGEVTQAVRQAMDELPRPIMPQVKLLGEVSGRSLRMLHGQVRMASFPTRYSTPVGSATVMEAIAAATPIVGSAALSRDVLSDGLTGLVVDTAPDNLAAGFRAMLDDDALWNRLSRGAARLAERFDACRVAADYLALVPGPALRPTDTRYATRPAVAAASLSVD